MKIRRDICLGGLAGLPAGSAAHGLTLQDQLALLRACGFEGVVAWDNWAAIRAARLVPVGMAHELLPATMGEGAEARPINYADTPEVSDRFAEAQALIALAGARAAAITMAGE